jgi:hypothetical protein
MKRFNDGAPPARGTDLSGFPLYNALFFIA